MLGMFRIGVWLRCGRLAAMLWFAMAFGPRDCMAAVANVVASADDWLLSGLLITFQPLLVW